MVISRARRVFVTGTKKYCEDGSGAGRVERASYPLLRLGGQSRLWRGRRIGDLRGTIMSKNGSKERQVVLVRFAQRTDAEVDVHASPHMPRQSRIHRIGQ